MWFIYYYILNQSYKPSKLALHSQHYHSTRQHLNFSLILDLILNLQSKNLVNARMLKQILREWETNEKLRP